MYTNDQKEFSPKFSLYFLDINPACCWLQISFRGILFFKFISYSSFFFIFNFGTEITADILPRLSAIEFNSGVVDELLFVDKPHEFRFPSGLMMLEYGKAIQESVYEQLRVVREGQLRIMFTPDLKVITC